MRNTLKYLRAIITSPCLHFLSETIPNSALPCKMWFQVPGLSRPLPSGKHPECQYPLEDLASSHLTLNLCTLIFFHEVIMLTLTLLNLILYYILSSLMEIFLEINQSINTDNSWIIWPKRIENIACFQVPSDIFTNWFHFVDMNYTFLVPAWQGLEEKTC